MTYKDYLERVKKLLIQVYYYNIEEDYIFKELILLHDKLKYFILKGKEINIDFYSILVDTIHKRESKNKIKIRLEKVLLEI